MIMTARKRYFKRVQKWKEWGRNVSTGVIMSDKDTPMLFRQMYRELEKVIYIKNECDITNEIIKKQKKKEQQVMKYESGIRQIQVILLAAFFIFIGLLLLFYVCRLHIGINWLTGLEIYIGGGIGLLLFIFFEWLAFRLYLNFEKED